MPSRRFPELQPYLQQAAISETFPAIGRVSRITNALLILFMTLPSRPAFDCADHSPGAIAPISPASRPEVKPPQLPPVSDPHLALLPILRPSPRWAPSHQNSNRRPAPITAPESGP